MGVGIHDLLKLMALPQSPPQASGESLIRSISGGADRCASPAAALRLIGQSTGHLPAKKRPSDADRRVAAAVVAALGEMVREQWDAQEESWRIEVPESATDLVRRTGASESEISAALRLLAETNVVASVLAAGQRWLRLSEEAFEEVPALARMDGEAVRRRLESADASVAPALAVIRELAVASGGYTDATQPGPWIEASLARLSEVTFFKRTAISKGLSDLEAARLIERSVRSGRQHSYRLLPQIFGADVPEPSAPPRATVPVEIHLPQSTTRVPPASATPGLIVEIGGVRLRIAPGIQCSLELDATGTPVLRTDTT